MSGQRLSRAVGDSRSSSMRQPLRPKRAAAADVELVVEAGCEIGESPLWDDARQRLIWVDIPDGVVHVYDGAGHHTNPPVGQSIGFVVPRRGTGFLVGVRAGLGTLDADLAFRFLLDIEAEFPENRMNDGKCGPDGRLWAGTIIDTADVPVGALYRVDGDFAVERVLTDLTCSNGLAWNTTGNTMYFTDSPTGRIDMFDYDTETGVATNRRPFVHLEGTPGTPDGLTIDAEDGLWVAVAGGGCVRRYLPDGTLHMEVAVPAPFVASCAFGGASYDQLYITSGRYLQTPATLATYPHSGALFVCRPGPVGVPAARFMA